MPASVLAQTSPAGSRNIPLVKDAAKALAAGNLQLADTDLQLILTVNPRDVHALNLLGILRVQQQREAEAERLFKQAIEIKPDFAGAHASLGRLYIETGRPEVAIPQLQEALRLDALRTDIRDSLLSLLRTEAREALRARNPEKALAALLQARQVSANDPDVEYELGMVALQMSLFPDAIDALQNVLALRSQDLLALYGLGRANIGFAKFPEAKECFTRYIQERPDDASGHYALGLALESLQENEQARRQFEQSISLRPVQTEAYFQLGRMDLEENKLESAAGHFQTVLQRDPKHAGGLIGMGRVAFQRKNYEEAADFLRRAIAGDAPLREAHYYLGLTYARLGRKEESEQEMQIASRLEHEEVEQHQQEVRILGLEEAPVPASEQSK